MQVDWPVALVMHALVFAEMEELIAVAWAEKRSFFVAMAKVPPKERVQTWRLLLFAHSATHVSNAGIQPLECSHYARSISLIWDILAK